MAHASPSALIYYCRPKPSEFSMAKQRSCLGEGVGINGFFGGLGKNPMEPCWGRFGAGICVCFCCFSGAGWPPWVGGRWVGSDAAM